MNDQSDKVSRRRFLKLLILGAAAAGSSYFGSHEKKIEDYPCFQDSRLISGIDTVSAFLEYEFENTTENAEPEDPYQTVSGDRCGLRIKFSEDSTTYWFDIYHRKPGNMQSTETLKFIDSNNNGAPDYLTKSWFNENNEQLADVRIELSPEYLDFFNSHVSTDLKIPEAVKTYREHVPWKTIKRMAHEQENINSAAKKMAEEQANDNLR